MHEYTRRELLGYVLHFNYYKTRHLPLQFKCLLIFVKHIGSLNTVLIHFEIENPTCIPNLTENLKMVKSAMSNTIPSNPVVTVIHTHVPFNINFRISIFLGAIFHY